MTNNFKLSRSVPKTVKTYPVSALVQNAMTYIILLKFVHVSNT